MALPAWSGLKIPAANCNVIAPLFPEPFSEEELVEKIENAVEMLARRTLSAAQHILIIVEDSSRPAHTAPVKKHCSGFLPPAYPMTPPLNCFLPEALITGWKRKM